jgi:hypothetical protein
MLGGEDVLNSPMLYLRMKAYGNHFRVDDPTLLNFKPMIVASLQFFMSQLRMHGKYQSIMLEF